MMMSTDGALGSSPKADTLSLEPYKEADNLNLSAVAEVQYNETLNVWPVQGRFDLPVSTFELSTDSDGYTVIKRLGQD